MNPEFFFLERGDILVNKGRHPGKRVCDGCPVRVECLDYALTANEREGVWGGLTPRERAKVRRERRRMGRVA